MKKNNYTKPVIKGEKILHLETIKKTDYWVCIYCHVKVWNYADITELYYFRIHNVRDLSNPKEVFRSFDYATFSYSREQAIEQLNFFVKTN